MSDVPTRSFGVGDFANPNRNSGMLASDSELRRVDVRLLDANPFQARTVRAPGRLADGPAVAYFMKDLDANGQLAPVCVRRNPADGTRFQLIYGHRRSEAFRRLLEEATSPAEVARWSHINAIIRTDIESDEQISALCIAENFQREDLTPFEEADSVATHMEVSGISSASQLAAALNVDAKRVTRLLRLHSAPAYVRKALESGVAPESSDGSRPKGKDKLDLMASIEWIRLHEHMVEKLGKKLEAVSAALTPRIEESIRDRWPYRRVKEYVDSRIAGRKERVAGASAAPATPVFREEKGVMTIQVKRLDGLSGDDRAALRATLEDLLARLSSAPQGEPGEPS